MVQEPQSEPDVFSQNVLPLPQNAWTRTASEMDAQGANTSHAFLENILSTERSDAHIPRYVSVAFLWPTIVFLP